MERRVTRLSSSASINSSTAVPTNPIASVLTPALPRQKGITHSTALPPYKALIMTESGNKTPKEGMDKLLEQMSALTASMDLLQTKTTNLDGKLDKLRVDIASDLKETKDAFDGKIEKLEQRLSTEQKGNYAELKKLWADQKSDTKIDLDTI